MSTLLYASRASRIRVDAVPDSARGGSAAPSTVHKLRAEVAMLRDELAQAREGNVRALVIVFHFASSYLGLCVAGIVTRAIGSDRIAAVCCLSDGSHHTDFSRRRRSSNSAVSRCLR